MTTIKYKAPFGRPETPMPVAGPVSRLARMLALGWYIDHLLEIGVVSSHQAVADALGVSDARVTQLIDLTLLSPRIQNDLVVGDLVIDGRTAHEMARAPWWGTQEEELQRRVESGATRKTARRWSRDRGRA